MRPSRNDLGGGAWPGGAPCAPTKHGTGLLSFQLPEAREPGSRASRRDLGASWGCHGWSEGIADMAHLRGFANQVRVGFWVVSGLPELPETRALTRKERGSRRDICVTKGCLS